MNVLIVDDDAVNRKLLRAQLETEGHRVIDASNGVEALKVLDREPRVDGIVSDILMPDMDGFRLCLEIRKTEKVSELPFIFYTSTYSSPQDQQLAESVGADNYLSKPSPTPVILRALEEAAQRTRRRIASQAARHDEAYVLKQYNESLVHKLEERNLELEETFRQLRKAHETLLDREKQLQLFVEHTPAAIAMLDKNMRYLAVSRRWLADYRVGDEDIIGRSHYEIFPEIPERWKEIHRRCLAGAVETREEDPFQRADGSLDWVRWEIHPWRKGDGEVGGLVLFSEVITQRKLQQEKIERLSRVRALSSGINAAIVRAVDKQELFAESCRIAVDHGNFGIAWIGRLDPRTPHITPVAHSGQEAPALMAAITASSDLQQYGKGVVGRAVRSRMPAFENFLSANQDSAGPRTQEVIRLGYQSRIALPLMADNLVIGVLVLLTKEKNFFTDEELKLLTELASNISFALEYMARQERIEKLSRVRAMTSEINAAIVRSRNMQMLFDEACRIAVEHGRFGMAWIGELDSAKLEVNPAASAGIEDDNILRRNASPVRTDGPHAQGVVPRAVRERRPVYSNDITTGSGAGGARRKEAIRRGYRSVIALPLLVDGAVAGTLSLFAQEANFFNDEEVNLLTELAGNISFGMESIARQTKVDKLSRIRSISSEINAAIVRARTRQELFDETCRITVDAGRFPFAWVGRIDRATGQISPVAQHGLEGGLFQAIRNGDGSGKSPALTISGAAVTERKAVVVNDVQNDPRVILKDIHRQRNINSFAVMPLFAGDEPVGILSLQAHEIGFFDGEEIDLLSELAENISFALAHIAQQDKVEKLSRIRTVLGEINAAIVRVHDRQALLEEACRIAAEAGRFPFVWIGNYVRAEKHIKPVAWAGTAAYSDTVGVPRPVGDVSHPGFGVAATVVLSGKAVIVNDVERDSQVARKQLHLDRGVRSLAVMPLIVSDEVAGVIALHAKEAGFFDDEEVELLRELSSDIGFALQTMEKQEKLDYLSYYDPLTGLPNRALFIDRAGQQMRARAGEPLLAVLVLINLDRFRNVNESFGRKGGDELLKLVARRLETAFNGKDYLARIGADGFGMMMRGIRDSEAVVHGVENMVLSCFHDPFDLNGTEFRVSAKAGVAMFPTDGEDADTLFKNAEAALKKVRESGERYLFYSSDMNARAAQLLSLETRLRRAVEVREFVLHYQPKIDLSSGRICGMEALIRWNEPGVGLVAPGTFIPMLEETGLILDVGRWALERALTDHREWTAKGCVVPRIAVNVSAIQLQQKDFADMVISSVQDEGDNPEALDLEVTESLLMKDVETSIRKLSILRGLGIRIALDDFGTGYSSLSYIARLPISLVKIDRSFIMGMAGNPQDMAIVTTIITLAHALNLKVVAEGVETAEQAKLLALLKCDEAQGYYFSKPLPATDIEPLLHGRLEKGLRRS